MASRRGGFFGFIQQNFGLVFGGIWLAVGLPFLVSGIFLWRQETRFAEEAVTAEGKVLTREIRSATTGSSGGQTSTQYWVRYRFQSRDGHVHEQGGQVNVHLWEELREQGPVLIQYLPDDPEVSRVAGEPDYIGPGIMAGIGGFFSLAGGGIFVFFLSRRLTQGRILRDGVPAEATVTDVGPTNFSVNKVAQWAVRYRYQDLYGRPHEGKSGYMTPQDAGEWHPGDTGRVKYDRERPEKSVWLGLE